MHFLVLESSWFLLRQSNIHQENRTPTVSRTNFDTCFSNDDFEGGKCKVRSLEYSNIYEEMKIPIISQINIVTIDSKIRDPGVAV